MRRLPRARLALLLAGLPLAQGRAQSIPPPNTMAAPIVAADDPLLPGTLWERRWHDEQALLDGWVGEGPAAEQALRQELTRRHGPAGAALAPAWSCASRVLPLVAAAASPGPASASARGGPEPHSLGLTLGEYANNVGTAPLLFESFAAASRRILDGTPPSRHSPEAVSQWLATASAALLAAADEVEHTTDPRSAELDGVVTDLRAMGYVAQFHSRRMVAAVHYNLFRRSLRLAELVAATLGEQQAVATWRRLVALARERHPIDHARGWRARDLSLAWAAELKQLEAGLKELEEQCCPPDEAVLKERVWSPAATLGPPPPALAVTLDRPPLASEPGARIVVGVPPRAHLRAVRLHYRPATVAGEYRPLPLSPNNTGREFAAPLPGDFGPGPTLYFLEATDRDGKTFLWPELHDGLAVRLARRPGPAGFDASPVSPAPRQKPTAAPLSER